MTSPFNIRASYLRATRAAAPRLRRPSSKASRRFAPATATPSHSLYSTLVSQSARKNATTPSPMYTSFSSSVIQHRTFATATELNTTAQPARPILNPRTDASGKAMRISLSPRASHRLNAIASSDANPNLALRITVESGGCHGFQYLMSLVDLSAKPPTKEDTVFEGDRGEKVVVDESSLELLSGSTVDYTMELIGSQFKVTGIPGATSSCGCGTSFDIKF